MNIHKFPCTPPKISFCCIPFFTSNKKVATSYGKPQWTTMSLRQGHQDQQWRKVLLDFSFKAKALSPVQISHKHVRLALTHLRYYNNTLCVRTAPVFTPASAKKKKGQISKLLNCTLYSSPSLSGHSQLSHPSKCGRKFLLLLLLWIHLFFPLAKGHLSNVATISYQIGWLIGTTARTWALSQMY